MTREPDTPPCTGLSAGNDGTADSRFRTFLAAMSSGITIYRSTDGERFICTEMNPAGCAISGIRRDDAVGRDIREIFPGADQMGITAVLRRVWATGTAEVVPAVLYRDERLSGWFEKRVVRISPEETVLIYEEISARREAEESLQQSEARFRSLFESMHEGFAFHEVICNDAGKVVDYRYLDLNPAFEKLTGLKRETTVGRTVRELLPDIEDDWIDTFGRVAQTGIPAERENYVKELDRYYRARAYSPRRGTFAVVFEEVTAQRRAQKELERHEAQLRVLFESSQAGIMLVDPDGMITMANRRMAEMFGYTLDEITGSPYPILVHPDQRSDGERLMQRLIRGETDFVSTERLYLRKDGSSFWGLLTGRRHLDSDGRLISLVGHITDITEHKLAEEAIREQEQYLQTIIDASPECIKLLARDGTLMMMNRSGLRMIEADSLAQVKGTCIYPLVVERDRQAFAGVTDRVFSGESVSLEFEAVGLHGTPLWLETHAVPFRNSRNEIVALLGLTRDITKRKLAEHRIRIFKETVDNATDAIGMSTPEGEHYYQNRAFDELFGDIGSRPHKVYVDQQVACNVFDTIMAGNQWTGELQMFAKDGSIRNILLRAYANVDDLGKVICLVGIHTDITERKQAEEELRLSEQKYASIFHLMPDMVGITRMADGCFIEVNAGFERLTGWRRAEVIGKSSLELGLWSPEARAEALSVLQRDGHVEEFNFMLGTRSGEQRIAQMYLTPITVNGDRCLYFMARDITERNMFERALRESEERFRSIMSLSPDIISIISREGELLYNSPAALQIHGYTQEEMCGINTLELIHPEDREEINRAFAQVIASPDRVVTVQYRYRNRDGSYFWMECSARNQLDNPHINGVIAISRCIEDRKRLEEERIILERQLLHVQKLESLGILAGGIAHDFNNILTAIIGNADMALMRLTPESPAVENLQRIEKAAARAADLARQMLAYSGKGKFVVETIDLNRLVEEMGHMLEVSISKKVIFSYHLTRPLPAVNVDSTQIRQIIMNLVINASEAIGDASGVIALTTGCQQCSDDYLRDSWLADRIPAGPYVFMEVTDSGCGMDRETLGKIFDPFFSTKFTGRGLGMAAVLGIIRGHGGTIKVTSEPGKGSSFKVLLPAGDQPAEPCTGTAGGNAWHGSGVALLVDDEQTVRDIGAEMLQALGFEAITAGDGRDALEQFRQRSDITVVILDLTMPRMDGEQCYRELRRIDPAVKVIMTSGFSESEISRKFAGTGVAGFVQKPYTLSDLRDVLKGIITP